MQCGTRMEAHNQHINNDLAKLGKLDCYVRMHIWVYSSAWYYYYQISAQYFSCSEVALVFLMSGGVAVLLVVLAVIVQLSSRKETICN